jgi:hypothetical protein
VQKQAGCIIGVDYPKPIVDHKIVSKENMNKIKVAYDEHKLRLASANGGYVELRRGLGGAASLWLREAQFDGKILSVLLCRGQAAAEAPAAKKSKA